MGTTDCDGEYELTFQERDGYLYAYVSCKQITAKIAVRYLRRIGDKCDELGAGRVMLERDIPTMLEEDDLFQTTVFFAQLMRGRKVAFVNAHAGIRDDMGVAVNIGLNYRSSYRLFDDAANAERWLLSGKEEPRQRRPAADIKGDQE